MDMDLEQKAIMRLREAADTSERGRQLPPGLNRPGPTKEGDHHETYLHRRQA